MKYKLKIFRSLKDQRQGALTLGYPLPKNILMFFPNVADGGVVHTKGMSESLFVVFLDKNFSMINYQVLAPNQMVMMPLETVHMVEFPVPSQIPAEGFEFLREYA